MTAKATLRLEMTTTDLASGLAGSLTDEDLLEFVGMLEKNVGRESFTMGLSWLVGKRIQSLHPGDVDVHVSYLGLVVRIERVKRGMSQETLAVASDLTQSKISRIERGYMLPRSTVIKRISMALGVDLKAILEQKGGNGADS